MLSLVALLLQTPEIDARVRLTGDACPGVALADRVRGQLSDTDAIAPLEAEGNLRRRDDGQWQLDLEIVHGDGEPTVRTFVAPACTTAIDAAALVIALAMDPSRAEPEPPPAAAEIPTPPSEPAPISSSARVATAPSPIAPSPVVPTPSSARRRTPKIRGLLRGGGGVDFGALPGAAAFFEATGGVLGSRWRAEIIGMFRLQSTDRARLDRTVGGRFSLWTIGPRGCGVPSIRVGNDGALQLPLCAGIEGGRLVVDGFGFAQARGVRRPWVASTIGTGLAWAPRPAIAIVLQATLGIPWIRSAIAIDNLERLHVTGSVFGRAWLGIEGRFP